MNDCDITMMTITGILCRGREERQTCAFCRCVCCYFLLLCMVEDAEIDAALFIGQ